LKERALPARRFHITLEERAQAVAAAVAARILWQILPLRQRQLQQARPKKTGGEMKFSPRVEVWVMAPKSFRSREAH